METLVIRLPIRNWNKEKPNKSVSMEIVIRLPIRNWNETKCEYQAWDMTVIRLPIRNWNYISDHDFQDDFFDSPYEYKGNLAFQFLIGSL